jgi:hypothetical protein
VSEAGLSTGGFILDPEELDEAHGEGEIVLDVSDGLVEAVEGDCPLAVAVRQDGQLSGLRSYVEDLHGRMLEVFEAAVDTLSRR